MLTCLKENASAVGLELKPKIISCDFEKGAFLLLDDIDEVWEEMIDSKPDLGEHNSQLEKFIEYFADTWINETCHFPRDLWNMFDVYSSRILVRLIITL